MSTKNMKDYLFTPDSQEFRKAQANLLLTDITNNAFMPEDPRISRNKGLNTTKKNVIAAINETFDMAHDALTRNIQGGNWVKTINGVAPDSGGNVQIRQVSQAIYDARNRRIDETYVTRDALPDVVKGSVKTVNGIKPDAQGNITIQSVQSVNGVRPNINGNVLIDLSGYATKEGVTGQVQELLQEAGARLYKITVNGIAPDTSANIKITHVEAAAQAAQAEHALSANHAELADQADQATSAVNAEMASKAVHDDKNNVISLVYATKEEMTQLENRIASGASGGSGVTRVVSVNGTKPDSYGNIQINQVVTADTALHDINGNSIEKTYVTKDQLAEALSSSGSGTGTGNVVIQSGIMTINGQKPDGNGNFFIDSVPKDGTGKNIAETYAVKEDTYTKEETDHAINEAIQLVTSSDTADALADDIAFTGRYISLDTYQSLLARIADLEEKITSQQPFRGTLIGMAIGSVDSIGNFVPNGSVVHLKEYGKDEAFVYEVSFDSVPSDSPVYRIFTTAPKVMQNGATINCRPFGKNDKITLDYRYGGQVLYWVGQHTYVGTKVPNVSNMPKATETPST